MTFLRGVLYVVILLAYNVPPWLWAKLQGKTYEWKGGPG